VLKEERFYKNDKLEGISKIYYPSGKLQVEVNFKDNEADGIFREYDETGKIINQETYKNGQLID
ncbi:MAG: hypothetical protein HXM13_03365, partial [Fusobacterium periodonticum]|nr:hypothetical protein [Fusobacterium periodonticum]